MGSCAKNKTLGKNAGRASARVPPPGPPLGDSPIVFTVCLVWSTLKMSPVIKMAVPLYVAFKNPFNLSKSCVISLKATAPSARPCLYSWYCHSRALGTIL